MSLQFVNITKFWEDKSIKLSDSFAVFIQNYDEKGNVMAPEELYTCTGFTLPKLEQDEETLEYGNVAQVFLTPKYDSCKEITLEFMERIKDNNGKPVTLSKILKLINEKAFQLNQKYDYGYMVNTGDYLLNYLIPYLEIKVMNNKLWRYNFKYHFELLKIVNYSIYNLDYQSDSPCKVTITLAFEKYWKEVINEPVWDDNEKPAEQPKPKESPKEDKYDPNGNVDVDGINVDGNNYSKKEDIEMNWKNAANQDDLHTMDSEPLLNPEFGELPDLDDDDMTPELQTEIYKQSMNDDDLASLRERPELAELKEMEDLDADDKSSNPPIENQVASNGQSSGGYKQPAIGSNGSSGGEAAANASQKASQKADLANKQEKKQEKQVASGEKTYGGLTASELGKRAAQADKNNPNGTYKAAAMNAVGLDAKARKEVETSYNAEMKKS